HHTCSLPRPPTPSFFFLLIPPPPTSTLFPYTTLFRSDLDPLNEQVHEFLLLFVGEVRATLAELGGELPQVPARRAVPTQPRKVRSEEHTSELQSRENLVCRLLLEKKKKK